MDFVILTAHVVDSFLKPMFLVFLKKNLSVVFILSCFTAGAQNFCDTLFTKKGDTIPCLITFINGDNIFYHYKHKHRVITDSYVSRSALASFRLHTPGVPVPPESETPQVSSPPVKFTEHDGIIYAAVVDNPPSYPGGINVLYSLLENTVAVTPKDVKIYGDKQVTVLYQLVIQSDGKLYGAGIKESCVQDYNLDSQAELLEREIMKKICMAGLWNPGIINGEKANMNIYLPVKFNIDKNRIVIYPTEYMYIFKHRQN